MPPSAPDSLWRGESFTDPTGGAPTRGAWSPSGAGAPYPADPRPTDAPPATGPTASGPATATHGSTVEDTRAWSPAAPGKPVGPASDHADTRAWSPAAPSKPVGSASDHADPPAWSPAAPSSTVGSTVDGTGARSSSTPTRPTVEDTRAWSPAAPGKPVGPASTDPTPTPDPSLSWTAPVPPDDGRPLVSFGVPEGYDERVRPRPLGVRIRTRTAVVAACVVLGVGLIGGAVTGSWLTGEDGADSAVSAFVTAGELWHSMPVDQLFPPTVQGQGAGPGGADRTWTRIAVAPDSGCANAFDPLLSNVLAPVGCQRLLRATYTDATQSYVTTVGILFTKADMTATTALSTRFKNENLANRTDLMPRPYAAKGTLAAGFGDKQRASWTVSVLTDAPVVVYAVSGWADGRKVDVPEPADEAVTSGGTTAPAQAGLGNEAQGLADRVERSLRRTVDSPSGTSETSDTSQSSEKKTS
ncbi:MULTISPECIES: hypothetical protein [unclassified Streptomyces]|uniref:hypothetical protein n=1 Tax=unclassified Streptomyces TaxID=2593676 RepID=UPI003320D07D